MCSFTPTMVPLPIPEEELKELVTKGKDWAIMHGISMRPKINFSEDSINFAPFVLPPTIILRSGFEQVVGLQTVFQELLHKVAYDREFLTACLENTVQVDPFTAKLFEIFEIVHEEGLTQPVGLGLFRCDYMMKSNDEKETECKEDMFYPSSSWKLVEANTIAAGFGWLGPASGLIHRYILQEMDQHEQLSNLPDNNALSGLCEGILEAWTVYGNTDAAILVVIEDRTYNICDQKFHEYRIKEINPKVKILRKNFIEIYNQAKLNLQKELTIDNHVVSVVYFRCGYEPCQYPTEDEWCARLLIERSKAIKCPNILHQLAGTKKVQQELSKPGALERFFDDVNKIKAIREVFVRIYGLEFDKDGEEAVSLALEHPERYVLKPQREGGGHNVHGAEVKEYVEKMKNSKERTAWILMERIFPPLTRGYMVRPGGTNPPPISEMVSELGIFGVIIGDHQKIISNSQVGHMLRTKIATAHEGGVAAGLGALDSPYLLDRNCKVFK